MHDINRCIRSKSKEPLVTIFLPIASWPIFLLSNTKRNMLSWGSATSLILLCEMQSLEHSPTTDIVKEAGRGYMKDPVRGGCRLKGSRVGMSLAELHPFICRHLPFWVLLCARRSNREKRRHLLLYIKIKYLANSFTSCLSLAVNSSIQKIFY